MIDWHSHILPEMDDGSRDVSESLTLLKMQREQGCDMVIATPHFYANDESVESFLERRETACRKLSEHKSKDLPQILLGAEVKYYPGISRMSGLNELKIEGSKLLLLEMSMSRWTEYTVRELVELAGSRDMTVVLAHVERYFSMQKRDVWDRLYGNGILMQVNATSLLEFSSKRRVISLLRDGRARFIGSDCHNAASRSPQMGKAIEIVRKKLGDGFVAQMNEYNHSLIKNLK